VSQPVHKGVAGPSWWEVAERPVAASLRPWVRRVCGYAERSAAPVRRRELPGAQVVVILELGPPIRIYESGGGNCFARHPGGFAAGVDETFTLTEHDGEQEGVQLDLTPAGARALFDLPMSELTGRAVSLRELLRPAERDLVARLGELPGWEARLDAVEAFLRAKLSRAGSLRSPAAWAVARIEGAPGLRIRDLCREVGYSERHLIALFRDQVGLPPRRYASLVRFDRLVSRVRCGRAASWGELAFQLGFADQAHLSREVRRFSGLTPTALAEVLAPPAAWAVPSGEASEVNSIQAGREQRH